MTSVGKKDGPVDIPLSALILGTLNLLNPPFPAKMIKVSWKNFRLDAYREKGPWPSDLLYVANFKLGFFSNKLNI